MTTYQADWESTLTPTDRAVSSPPNYVEMIETVISSMEEEGSAVVNHGEEGQGHLWRFNYGTITVYVQLTGTTDEDALKVWSSVLPLPARDEGKLMRQLLEMSWDKTFEARFGIFNDEVVVLSCRTVADLSAGEISRAITVVANVADDNDEVLQLQFGHQ